MQTRQQVAIIADGDESFRSAASSILRHRLKMARVIETESLDEALEALAQQPTATLAVFDLALPGMGTPASLMAIRELFPDILVAVVSASQRRIGMLLSLQVGVHGYIPKDLGADQLTSALQSILHGHVYVPPSLSGLQQRPAEDDIAALSQPSGGADVLALLTPSQRNVLELLVRGHSIHEIARLLELGEGTVKIHVAALIRHLGVRNRAGAAAAGSRLVLAPDRGCS